MSSRAKRKDKMMQDHNALGCPLLPGEDDDDDDAGADESSDLCCAMLSFHCEGIDLMWLRQDFIHKE